MRCLESAVEFQDGGHNHDIHSSLMERTTSLHRDRTGYHSRESRDKSKKIKQRDAIIEKLLKTTAIDMPMNENLDKVFNDDVAEATQKFLKSEVSEDSVSEYVFI